MGMNDQYFTDESQHSVDQTLRAFSARSPNRPPERCLRGTLCVGVLISLLAGALSGCALSNAFEKCGFSGCPGDTKITADVRSQFSRCSFLEPNAINVQTLDHVVYLNGAVVSGLEISTAESIARQVPDVRRVINSIVALNVR